MRAIAFGFFLALLSVAAIFLGCGSNNDDPIHSDKVNHEKEHAELRGLIASLDSALYRLEDRVNELTTRVAKIEKRCGSECCR